MSKLTSAELKADAVPSYALAGNATITLLSGNTDKPFTYKIKNAKDKEADEVFSYMASGKNENYLTESEITKAFQGFEIDASEKEIKEMMKFIVGEEKEGSNEKIKVSKEQFKKFYTDNK